MVRNNNILVKMIILMCFHFVSCIDPCKEKTCYNGYCIEGDCFCHEGYSGVNCEIKESDKFVGNYSGKIICPEGQQPIKIKITNSPDDPRSISILHDNFGQKINLRGKIIKDSIFIPNQWISGSGFTNLFMPSKGKLQNGSILNYDLIFYYSDDEIDTCRIDVIRN
ncbi:MAG: hypothetical protein ACM3PT_04860 [Deltaproteobacteria bacterium]